MGSSIARRSRSGAPSQGSDVVPELTPGDAFGLGQPGQAILVADTCQGGVAAPLLQPLCDRGPGTDIGPVEPLAPPVQVGTQPVVGLLAQAGALRVVKAGRVLASAATGQRS